jgi:hypothetical protein
MLMIALAALAGKTDELMSQGIVASLSLRSH